MLEDISLESVFPVTDREWQFAMEALDIATNLQQYQDRIRRNNGISIPDAISIESISPGLLNRAPGAFSYRPSTTNLVYSQEAIGEKIDGLLKQGKVVLDKVIAWIREQCKKIKEVYTASNLRRSIDRFNVAISRQSTHLTIPQILTTLNDDTVSYDNHGIVRGLGSRVRKELKLTDFTNVRTKDINSWFATLGDLGIVIPKILVWKQENYKSAKQLWISLNDYSNDPATAHQRISENPIYQELNEREGGKLTAVDKNTLLRVKEEISNERNMQALLGLVQDIDVTTNKLSKSIDDQWRNRSRDQDVATLKKNRAALHEALRTIATFTNDVRDALSVSTSLLQWGSFSLNYTVKENIIRIRDAGDLSAD